MDKKLLTDMQKVSSRCNSLLSMVLFVYFIFYFVEKAATVSVFWLVVSGILFVIDSILATTILHKKSTLWIAVRIVELMIYSLTFIRHNTPAILAITSLMLLCLMLQLIFSFDYSDIFIRVITELLVVLPAAAILLINVLVSSMDMKEVFEKTGILMSIVIMGVYLSKIVVKELDKLEQKLFEQRRLADNTKEINEELKLHQEKVKKVNKELGVQKIKLEAAYNRINSANTEMILQNDILKAITSVLDIKQLLRIMTESLKNELMLSCCAIVLNKNTVENDEPICVMKSVFSEEAEATMLQRICDGALEEYMHYRNGYVDNHVRAEQYEFLVEKNTGSLLVIPLYKDNHAIGALLSLYPKFDYFTDNRVFFDTIMVQFLIALDNALLYAKMQNMAVRDGLTGIYNRRHLNVMMDQFCADAVKNEQPLSVALFDIDHFKHVNDTYGHLFGDLVITSIAGLARDMAKKYHGMAARYGGEEFVLAFPEKTVDECLAIVEEMRENVHNMKLEYEGMYVGVNVSVGVTGYPTCCKHPDVLLQHADWAMYYSKEHGRDRVTVDSEEIRSQLNLAEEN